MPLYQEAPDAGNQFREIMLGEVNSFIDAESEKANHHRKQYFQPEISSITTYQESLTVYRQDLRQLLGYPLTLASQTSTPSATYAFVAEDELGTISRVHIETLHGIHTYGLFFRPHGTGPFPLVISQHGGLGTPELTSGFFGSANYNDMTRRILRRGCAVFAPQLLLWDAEKYGPDHQKDRIDGRLKQLGGSLAAFELYRIFTALDHFTVHKDVDAERIGMVGLSYGGFYALFAAALDQRIQVVLSSGYFNDRVSYHFNDRVWTNAAYSFTDFEVAALVAPRPLFVEIGKQDWESGTNRERAEIRKLSELYKKLNIAEKFHYKQHDGGHEFDTADDGIEFLCHYLNMSSKPT